MNMDKLFSIREEYKTDYKRLKYYRTLFAILIVVNFSYAIWCISPPASLKGFIVGIVLGIFSIYLFSSTYYWLNKCKH